ncbi:hypothetical protein DFH11DRAFT_1580677 [Phellopilus nigrolimitatus]|nr:hypothetical protein DFH11DRAFT_1580677 [Phellopilus nigrolimitatus]
MRAIFSLPIILLLFRILSSRPLSRLPAPLQTQSPYRQLSARALANFTSATRTPTPVPPRLSRRLFRQETVLARPNTMLATDARTVRRTFQRIYPLPVPLTMPSRPRSTSPRMSRNL